MRLYEHLHARPGERRRWQQRRALRAAVRGMPLLEVGDDDCRFGEAGARRERERRHLAMRRRGEKAASLAISSWLICRTSYRASSPRRYSHRRTRAELLDDARE